MFKIFVNVGSMAITRKLIWGSTMKKSWRALEIEARVGSWFNFIVTSQLSSCASSLVTRYTWSAAALMTELVIVVVTVTTLWRRFASWRNSLAKRVATRSSTRIFHDSPRIRRNIRPDVVWELSGEVRGERDFPESPWQPGEAWDRRRRGREAMIRKEKRLKWRPVYIVGQGWPGKKAD